MFRKMPFLLLFLIVGLIAVEPLLPNSYKALFYGLSISVKSLILLLLPFIIFGLLFKTAVQLATHSTKILALLLILVCGSNFISTFISHYVGSFVYLFDFTIALPPTLHELSPSFDWQFPCLIANDHAMLAGMLLGILGAFCFPKISQKLAVYCEQTIQKLLAIVMYVLPIFITGFMLKLISDGNLTLIIKQYAYVLASIFLAFVVYLSLLYTIASGFKWRATLQALKNMLPAALTGFSTMSSAAAMPMTLVATQKNVSHPLIARATVPATVNIHLVGDCFAIPILAYAILKSHGMAEPMLWNYLIFAGYFVIAKFSVAAVPGGGILVMLPILSQYLGFDGAMLSLITALYVLFDPFITAANVLGNGAFAMLFDKIQSGFLKKKAKLPEGFSVNIKKALD